MFIQIANAERLAMEAAARVFEPPPVVDYVEWAKDNIIFSDRESPYPGPFNVERFPHVAPILAALSPEDPCRVVTLAGSAQIGRPSSPTSSSADRWRWTPAISWSFIRPTTMRAAGRS
jgi:phage terminase large subunit GpA-like protein